MNASIPVSLHLKDADAVGGHACRWQSMVVQLAKALAESEVRAAGLEALVAERDEDIDAYKRRLYGHKSEKMPGPNKALLKRGDIAKPTPEEIQRRRAEGRNWKEELPTEDVVHLVPTTTDICGLCGTPPNHALPSQVSYTVDIVPSRVVRHRHIREYARCECGSCVISGPAPVRVGEKGHYGPRLAASLIVAKCLDAVAIERYAKQLARMGVPVSVNTLSDLFHRAGEMLVRLYNLLLAQVKASDLVHADETRQQALDNMGPVPRTPAQTELYAKTRRAWVWVFIAGKTIVYKYSPSRSGETPVEVLGSSPGTLIVDAYTGYNQVTTPTGRDRGGCMSHGRRGLFDALPTAPEMQRGLDLILDLYKVEHDVKAAGLGGTAEHGAMRRARSIPKLAELKAWLDEQKARQLPRSKAGEAVAYMLNQWVPLTRFAGNPKIPIDNNISERMLRVIARGRATYLFVGNDKCGQNLAVLMSLVHTAEACGHNPEHYLADVLVRYLGHPVNRLYELLPQNWTDPANPTPVVDAAQPVPADQPTSG